MKRFMGAFHTLPSGGVNGDRNSAAYGLCLPGYLPTMIFMIRIAAIMLALVMNTAAYAHGGGLDKHGCHHNRKAGGYTTPPRQS